MLRSAFRVRSAFMTQRRHSACVGRSFASYPPHEIVGLPSLSPTMEMGNMSKWNKQEGDAISAGDIVCEIETDKAVVDYEATDDMFLAKILIPEGTQNIPVGQPMMVVCEEEESIASFKDFKVEATQAAPAVSPPEKEKSSKKEDIAVKAETTKPAVPQKTAATLQPPKKVVESAKSAARTDQTAPSSQSSTSAVNAVFDEKWGFGMKKSAISTSLIKKQQAYVALYGITGMTPLELPSKK